MSTRHRVLSRSIVIAAGAAGVLLLAAGPAAAHVDPDPLAVQVGTTADVAFGVEHGCDDSPTTKLELKFPDGFTNLKPVEKQGWTATVAGQVVTFAGGKLDAKTPDDFAVNLTAPATAGTQYIPVVQTCEKGSLQWIEIPKEGAAEPEHPAAGLKLTAGAPTAEDLAPAEEEGEEAGAHNEGAASDDHDGSNMGVIVGVVVAAVVVVGAGLVVVKRKRAAA